MTRITILEATEKLDIFIKMLDDLYWETASMDHKDILHNLSRNLTDELIELHKVSIQDGHFKYEPISEQLRSISPQLGWLADNLSQVARRTRTYNEAHKLVREIQLLIN
ncbi:hypothetical protein ACFOSD_07265 [Salinispirillum marinum]|uniref:Uncharacterized protein n=2 Tax=Saccharospirillaceae TaxID=255527 RepID=A0ABV8BCR8_9GAMM